MAETLGWQKLPRVGDRVGFDPWTPIGDDRQLRGGWWDWDTGNPGGELRLRQEAGGWTLVGLTGTSNNAWRELPFRVLRLLTKWGVVAPCPVCPDGHIVLVTGLCPLCVSKALRYADDARERTSRLYEQLVWNWYTGMINAYGAVRTEQVLRTRFENVF